MLTEVSARTAAPAPAPPTAPADAAPARSAWWVRLLARVPWAVGYGFATVLGWLAFRVFPYRERLVRALKRLKARSAIPGAHRVAEGDLISVDVGITLDGLVADSAYTFRVGDIDPERLTQVRCDLPALEHRRL